MKATTPIGDLQKLNNAYLVIPGLKNAIVFNNLPEIGDSKSANYNTEGIIGRASPIHTYSHSDTRQISLQLHFYVLKDDDVTTNLQYVRAIQSCVYPRQGKNGAPFGPPPICRLRFGNLLADNQDLCVVLQQYSVRYPTEVAFDESTYCPYKIDMDTTWWVVYTSSDLPFQTRIISSGR